MTGLLYLGVFYIFFDVWGNLDYLVGCLPLESMWFESDPGGEGCLEAEHSGPFCSLSRNRQD